MVTMKFFDRPRTRKGHRILGAIACCFFVGPMLGFTVRRFVAGDSVAWAAAVGVVFFLTKALELSRASDTELEERAAKQAAERAEFERELDRARSESAQASSRRLHPHQLDQMDNTVDELTRRLKD
jgi:hypothetical protein